MPHPHRRFCVAHAPVVTALLAGLLLAGSATAARAAAAGHTAPPAALTHALRPLAEVARHEAPSPDFGALLAEDARREAAGEPPRFALPEPVSLTPDDAGTWERLDRATRVWRLRVSAPGALSLNLGFTRFRLPKAARLCVYPAADPARALAWTADDNAGHGQLWTPLVPGDALVVELTLPDLFAEDYALELGSVNVGYRDFGRLAGLAKAGTCNIDVVCPQGDAWRDEIPAVGAISSGGSIYCTGFLVNNTARDEKPYFMTAYHCGVTAANAASLVVYWNFQSPVCGQQGGGALDQFQSGAYFRAAGAGSDFTLVELAAPVDPVADLSFAGWSRANAGPTSAVGIHHPNGDEKSISFTYEPTPISTYLGAAPGDSTHLQVTRWDVGTTEPGSSGSPLFDQNHHVVGQLHGGYAACGNTLSDYYGRFAVSWRGAGTDDTGLRHWLDPLGTGEASLPTLVMAGTGLHVEPPSGFASAGDPGGPFTPEAAGYTLTNRGTTPLDWQVSHAGGWLTVTPASGTLYGAGQAALTATINGAAAALAPGVYADTLRVVNATDHAGDIRLPVRLQVGAPTRAYAWNLDSNPGWTMEGQWGWGPPQGGGGLDHGFPDPTYGHDGANVLGYNLDGDYPDNLPETSLTTTAIDCSALNSVELRFWRWLGVEQPAYDHASIRVSTDGAAWTTVWQNTGEVADAAWSQQSLDLTALAAHRPTVYLRWVMGATDASFTYCGWNLDDIEIWGFTGEPPPPPPRTALLGGAPNPFGTDTGVRVSLAAAGRARLSILDARGRLVRVLWDGDLPAGASTLAWDGRDASGRPVPSGVYLLRFAAGGVVQESKVARVR